MKEKNEKNNLKKDWRYSIAHKEALIGLLLVGFHFIWWFGFAYGLGSKPVESYTYIWGIPAWFFYSCMVGFVVIVVIVIAVVKILFRDIPLESGGKGDTL